MKGHGGLENIFEFYALLVTRFSLSIRDYMAQATSTAVESCEVLHCEVP